jgi:hypothetical protein
MDWTEQELIRLGMELGQNTNTNWIKSNDILYYCKHPFILIQALESHI